jgi:hypothetical protein
MREFTKVELDYKVTGENLTNFLVLQNETYSIREEKNKEVLAFLDYINELRALHSWPAVSEADFYAAVDSK